LISCGILFDRRVLEFCLSIKLIVHKLQKNYIEIQESRHDPVIDIDRQVSRILERNNISYLLAHNLRLVIDTLNADKHLLERVSSNGVKLEMPQKLTAKLNFFSTQIELLVSGENSKQRHQR